MAAVATAHATTITVNNHPRIIQGRTSRRYHLTNTQAIIVNHMNRRGYITARDAMVDYGLSSGSLTRRIVELEEKGVLIRRTQHRHPVSGRIYTRYSLAGRAVF